MKIEHALKVFYSPYSRKSELRLLTNYLDKLGCLALIAPFFPGTPISYGENFVL